MSNVWAEIGSNGFYVADDSPGSTYILMDSLRPDDERRADYIAMADGTWAIDPMIACRAAVEAETAWKAAELLVVADQLLRIEDGDPAALPGNDRQWRDYRIQLRAWVEGADHFPDVAYRPARPVAA